MPATIRRSMIAALAATLLTSGYASAYNATAFEQAELAQLSPNLRSQVETRLTGEQTVRSFLDVMLLNNISADFATNKVVAADFDKGVVVVEGKNGDLNSYPFDVATLVIKH